MHERGRCHEVGRRIPREEAHNDKSKTLEYMGRIETVLQRTSFISLNGEMRKREIRGGIGGRKGRR